MPAGRESPSFRAGEDVKEAVERVRARRRPAPYKPEPPMQVRLRLTTAAEAEAAARRSGARRVDEHTVECRVARQDDIFHWTSGRGLV